MSKARVLFLGYPDSDLISWLRERGHQVTVKEEPLTLSWLENEGFEWCVSYGYRYLIKQPVIDYFDGRIVNLHISYLPWNRGADPNFWSFWDDTPKGVSIHRIDAGLDTGELFTQREIEIPQDATLESSYWLLRASVEQLFKASWADMISGQLGVSPQPEGGSYHALKDRDAIWSELPLGWKTPVAEASARKP